MLIYFVLFMITKSYDYVRQKIEYFLGVRINFKNNTIHYYLSAMVGPEQSK